MRQTALVALVAMAAPLLAFAEEPAPRYTVEAIEFAGNDKTHDDVIAREITVRAGETLSVDDARFEVSRYRLLSLGYFSDVRLRLRKGSKPGRVVLVVEVVERGTIVLTDIFFGTSKATAFWGGLGVAERNLLGRGIGLEAALVLGSDPNVDRGDVQQAYWLRVTSPALFDVRLEGNASFLYLFGSEFFRRAGEESSSDPVDFLSVQYQRVGASAGVGFDLLRHTRLNVEYRGEAIEADIPSGAVKRNPDGTRQPIPFGVRDGLSRLSNLALSFERDTRSDPVLPARGGRLNFEAEFSTQLLGSDYDYLRLTASYRHYFTLRWGHVLSAQFFGGVIFGEAPFFEKFFVGDFNDLVPGRALGLNFSTLPSRDIFGTAIDSKRYEEIALRTSVEYVIPWFRGGKWFYGGDFFFNVGVIFMTSKEELRLRDRPLSESIPVDLTLDAGLRLDTRIGIFRLSIGNALGRIPF